MRAGGCTVQQCLTAEAASEVKQAVTLARRRGHAQVTPLHVANTMLSSSTGVFRTACLHSHSHPLQCKALELCFNVALNRLPASASTPAVLLGTSPAHSNHHHHRHHQYPTISNALVAAFKRAQAHQRRGSAENQQQAPLAVKIELEQLVISILDDPSVSRVMREAGFSSTQVKSNIEQAVVSLEICSQSTTPTDKPKEISSSNTNNFNNVLVLPHHQSAPTVTNVVDEEDVMYVIENLMSKRKRNLVIVGECVASAEGVVRRVMDKFAKGDDDDGDVPEALRDVKFIPFSLSSFRHMKRAEVEEKVEEIKNLVRSTCSLGINRGGVVLSLGDLEWAEFRANSSEQVRGYYCSIEHLIMELGKLVRGIEDGNNYARFWLIGVATFQTYMRCKSGHPSLESLWGLHPLTIPAASLRLTLTTTVSDLYSDFHIHSSTSKRGESGASWRLFDGKDQEQQLTCCADCSAKFEVRSLQSSASCNTSDSTTSSSLPAWLQQYKNENKSTLSTNINDKQDSGARDLCKKWNSICNSSHEQPYYSERTLAFSSVSPSSPTYSGFSYEHNQQNPNPHKTTRHDWSVVEPEHPWREHHFLISSHETSDNNKRVLDQPSLRLFIPEHSDKDLIKQVPFSSSNPNSTPSSTSSSDVLMEIDYVTHNPFKELNAENLTTLCNALEKKVPWQKDIVPEIASTVLKCRSGMMRRKAKVNEDQNEVIKKEETWFFFQGVDVVAKEKVAKELARVVFGSCDNFISIALSSFSSTRADSTDHHQDHTSRFNKRSRDEQSCCRYIERFCEAVSSNPHRVFLIEDVEQADYCSQKGFKRAIETGSIASNGDDHHEVSLGDAIIILSCESFSSRSRAGSPPIKQKSTNGCDEEEKVVSSTLMSLDLNICIDDHDESTEDDQSIDDIGLLDSVDKRIIFKSIE